MVTWIGFGRKRSCRVERHYHGGNKKDHEKLGPSKFRARNPERKSGVLSPERTEQILDGRKIIFKRIAVVAALMNHRAL